MATLKELKEEYRIGKLPSTGEYLIYDKTKDSGKRCVFKYLCSLEKKNNRFKIIGTDKYYSKLSDIMDAISRYVSELEFDSEYYDPSWRNGLFEELVINDYMYERGFKSSNGWHRDTCVYVLTDKNIYLGDAEKVVLEIQGIGASDELPEEVDIRFKTSAYSWIGDSCKRNVYDIMKTIDSLLKPYFISEATRNINHADDYKLEQFRATINKFDTKAFETLTTDFKVELKTKLQDLIDAL